MIDDFEINHIRPIIKVAIKGIHFRWPWRYKIKASAKIRSEENLFSIIDKCLVSEWTKFEKNKLYVDGFDVNSNEN